MQMIWIMVHCCLPACIMLALWPQFIGVPGCPTRIAAISLRRSHVVGSGTVVIIESSGSSSLGIRKAQQSYPSTHPPLSPTSMPTPAAASQLAS